MQPATTATENCCKNGNSCFRCCTHEWAAPHATCHMQPLGGFWVLLVIISFDSSNRENDRRQKIVRKQSTERESERDRRWYRSCMPNRAKRSIEYPSPRFLFSLKIIAIWIGFCSHGSRKVRNVRNDLLSASFQYSLIANLKLTRFWFIAFQ